MVLRNVIYTLQTGGELIKVVFFRFFSLSLHKVTDLDDFFADWDGKAMLWRHENWLDIYTVLKIGFATSMGNVKEFCSCGWGYRQLNQNSKSARKCSMIKFPYFFINVIIFLTKIRLRCLETSFINHVNRQPGFFFLQNSTQQKPHFSICVH